MRKRLYFVFLLLYVFVSVILLFIGEIYLKQNIISASPIARELENIYNRYSVYLDSQWTGNGWNYSVPSRQYNEVNKDSFNNIRMQATFADFYKYRKDLAAKDKIGKAIKNAFIELPGKQANAIPVNGIFVSTRSFNESIGMYLALQILSYEPKIFTKAEQSEIINNIRLMYPWALQADDTENRAFIGAAYAIAILNNPLLNFSEKEKIEYLALIKKKVEKGLESLDKNYYYREGSGKEFSLHYHLVSAYMLYYIGSYLHGSDYINISKRMFFVVRADYPLGKLDWNGSVRPTGIGLQTIFLRSLGENFLGNSNWKIYWDTEKNGYGFVDPKNSDRLVWKDEVDKTYNDDYSFANMTELFLDFIK